MSTTIKTEKTEALEQWIRSNNGYLAPSVRVVEDLRGYRGVYWQATEAISSGTNVSSVPHSFALSYLNALVDDTFPALKQAKGKLAVENIGFLYLMAQYVNREKSFWKPYLATLPQPQDDFLTPLWFDDAEDAAWLEETDVFHSTLARKEVYERYWRAGVDLLKQSGIDTDPYTWDLFRWAVTIFTSRCFSSRAIAPQDSKYWTTYKSTPDGSRRQTVILDMSRTPAEDLDFPVLFPMQDVPNHHHDAKVDWTFDPGRFSVTLRYSVELGQEVINNYGPKGNEELLLGYGFCIPDNPHDAVLLTLKPPPQELQKRLRQYHAGYFIHGTGDWNGERATFKVSHLLCSPGDELWHRLPEPLLELMLYILHYERGLPFTFVERPLLYLTKSNGRRYLPHIARMIVQSLVPKLQKLQAISLPPTPKNAKQRAAQIYRQSQISILQSSTSALRTFTRNLRPRSGTTATTVASKDLPNQQRRSQFLTLEEALTQYFSEYPQSFQKFILGLQASTNTVEIDVMRAAGWEEDLWVLLLCAMYLCHGKTSKSPSMSMESRVGGETPDKLPGRSNVLVAAWMISLLDEYGDPLYQSPQADTTSVESNGPPSGLMDIVFKAREARPAGTFWHDERWSEEFIQQWGGRILRCESTMMMVQVNSGEEDTSAERAAEEARLVLYLHCEGEQ